ncbi:hypothetical protein DL96DRAFT_868348 [Flagelloscypha sp. PMI_526]|nr:hypothetical protein DL96DRAFT_868348 [Flagelloscypha sp. PMI_526]
MNSSDQRPNDSNIQQSAEDFTAGQANAHNIYDKNDTYSLGNRAKLEQKMEEKEKEPNWRDEYHRMNPTSVAEEHGNKPSSGARVDEELLREDEEMLRKKDERRR